jgi:hypothetical protein
VDDLVRLFDSVNKSTWSDRLKVLNGIHPIDGSKLPTIPMNRSAHPLVDSYCLYGSNISTSYAYVFDENIETTSASQVLRMDGDDNQDIYDNEFCMIWSQDPHVKNPKDGSNKFHFEAQAFPNVHHMEMFTDNKVLEKIKAIVDLYAA